MVTGFAAYLNLSDETSPLIRSHLPTVGTAGMDEKRFRVSKRLWRIVFLNYNIYLFRNMLLRETTLLAGFKQ